MNIKKPLESEGVPRVSQLFLFHHDKRDLVLKIKQNEGHLQVLEVFW